MYIVLIKQAQKDTLETIIKSINISYNLDFIRRYNVIFYFCNHYYNVICIRYEKFKYVAAFGPSIGRVPAPRPAVRPRPSTHLEEPIGDQNKTTL